MSPSESASLAIEHLQYVAMLSLLFVVAAALYLASFWTVAWRLTTPPRILIHTLYLLWQSPRLGRATRIKISPLRLSPE